jgi:hypothetical protein
MSTPEIQYSGPHVSESVPWDTRRHLQLLYQKLGNHTQAFALIQKQVAAIKAGSTTTSIEEVGGASGGGGANQFIGQGLINNQTGETAYSTGPGDNGILLILDDASAVAVTLTTAAAPFFLFVTNFGSGAATLTPSTGLINGGASLTLLQNQSVLASCDSTNWQTTAFLPASSYTPAGGTTGSRPGSPTLYQTYFDTTLGLPVWWSGSNWVNAAGVIS